MLYYTTPWWILFSQQHIQSCGIPYLISVFDPKALKLGNVHCKMS